MIRGIGIDIVNVDRFNEWHTYSPEQLRKTLSEQEIAYCMSKPHPAQHFATRFAAKEAFFKALSMITPALPFLTVCKATEVVLNAAGRPELRVAWQAFSDQHSTYTIHCSLSHESSVACAVVIVEEKP